MGTAIGASEDAKRRRRYRRYDDYYGNGYYGGPYVNYANGSRVAYDPLIYTDETYVNYADEGPPYVNYAEGYYTQQSPGRRGGYARRASRRRSRSGRTQRGVPQRTVR